MKLETKEDHSPRLQSLPPTPTFHRRRSNDDAPMMTLQRRCSGECQSVMINSRGRAFLKRSVASSLTRAPERPRYCSW